MVTLPAPVSAHCASPHRFPEVTRWWHWWHWVPSPGAVLAPQQLCVLSPGRPWVPRGTVPTVPSCPPCPHPYPSPLVSPSLSPQHPATPSHSALMSPLSPSIPVPTTPCDHGALMSPLSPSSPMSPCPRVTHRCAGTASPCGGRCSGGDVPARRSPSCHLCPHGPVPPASVGTAGSGDSGVRGHRGAEGNRDIAG